MPVASSQREAQLCRYRHILPKPPGFHGGQISPTLMMNPDTGYLPEMDQIASIASSSQEATEQNFSTNSPPILNLSPNLSPAEPQRTSPFYDLRESTRRRSAQDNLQGGYAHQHSPHIYSGILEDTGRKSESPNRKRRKTSGSIIDLSASPSPSPPSRVWEASNESSRPIRRRNSSQRRGASERNNPGSSHRSRRSPLTRRRTREHPSSPDRRAFHPPTVSSRQVPAPVAPHQPSQSIVIDMEQVQASSHVTMPQYAIPLCTGAHHIPVCTSAHIPVCTSQPTWSFPGCRVQIPSCGVQHIPACSLQQMPIGHNSLPHVIHHHHHPPPAHPHHHHHPHPHQPYAQQQQQQHHLVAPPHYVARHPAQLTHEEEVQLLAEHRHRQPYHIPTMAHGPPVNHTSPVLLQEPSVHPAPPDLFGPFSQFYRRAARGNRLRSLVPPPPPYPGFLLHFLAMLGNPSYPTYGMERPDDSTEVENYEALLNLAERLGEAKPRGLTKAEIDLLPAYKFNSENHQRSSDQTSCVVCMCDFEARQNLRILPCSHEFHTKCVDKWLKTNRTCPICRADSLVIQSE